MMSRERPWPAADATLVESVLGFLQFVHTTAVNKVAGLDEQQARAQSRRVGQRLDHPVTDNPALA